MIYVFCALYVAGFCAGVQYMCYKCTSEICAFINLHFWKEVTTMRYLTYQMWNFRVMFIFLRGFHPSCFHEELLLLLSSTEYWCRSVAVPVSCAVLCCCSVQLWQAGGSLFGGKALGISK